MTLKKTFGLFCIGVLLGIFNLIIEYYEYVLQEENPEDVELRSFLYDYLSTKGMFILLIFIIFTPITMYLSFLGRGVKLGYIVLIITGYGWFGILVWVIELFMGIA